MERFDTCIYSWSCSVSGSSQWVQLETANNDDANLGVMPKETMAAAGGMVDNTTMIVFGGCTSSCCFAVSWNGHDVVLR